MGHTVIDKEWPFPTLRRFQASVVGWLLACLLLPTASYAIDPSVRLSELHHTTWRSDDGAPPNIVALAQTPDGFLWLGTGGGLFRFDGIRFDRITSLSGKQLLTTSITALHTTTGGALVIGYRFGGLSVYDNEQLTNYTVADGLPPGNAWAFVQGEDGDVWAAFTGGVTRRHAGEWKTQELDGEMLPFRTMLRDAEGNIWVTAKTGAYVLLKGRSGFQRAQADLPVFPFLSLAPDGRIWATDFQRQRISPMSREGEGFRLSPATEEVPLPLSGDLHWFDTGGGLWIRTREGLLRVAKPLASGESQRAETFSWAKGLSGEIYSFLEDREGNIWLGTAGGLHRFTHSNVRRVELGLDGGSVGVAPGDGADVWAITAFGGLFRVGESVRQYPNVAQYASHMHRDQNGIVWIGSRNALWRIDADGTLVEMERPDISSGKQASVFAPIHAIAKDREGVLWLHTVINGTFRRLADRWVRVPEGPHDRIMSMGNDAQGRLWIGYVDRGASRVDGDEVLSFEPGSQLNIGAVSAIYGRGTRVWLGGQHGLALFDGATMRTLSLRGLDDITVVTGIVETASGQLWINAANGLTRIDANEWQRALIDPNYIMQVQRFGPWDGLLGSASQIRPLPSLIEAGDGRLWMALPSGLFVVDPARLRRNNLPPTVIIRGLTVDGKDYDSGDPGAMPVGRADLRIAYTATSLTVPQKVQFRYKLEGYDSDWQDASGRREATYTRVGPGDYVFRVVASNNDGVWNDTGASISFTVPPAFWQTRWFAAVALAAAALLLLALYRLRIWQISTQLRRRLETRLQERERIARELHDTLLQSITGLTLHVRAAANQVPEGSPLRERLEIALNRANEVAVEGRDRVAELRQHQEVGIALHTTLMATCQALSDAMPGPTCQVQVVGTLRELNGMVSDEAARVVYEAVCNSLRHANAKAIHVLLDYNRDELRVTVRDDGEGIQSSSQAEVDLQGHFGLAGMRERADRIGGQLKIETGKQGTIVSLTVPARIAYAVARRC